MPFLEFIVSRRSIFSIPDCNFCSKIGASLEKHVPQGVDWLGGVEERVQQNSRDERSSFARVHQAHPDVGHTSMESLPQRR